MRRLSAVFTILFLFAAFPAAAEPLRAAVSIAAQKYMLQRIAGDAVQVTVLAGPGQDPHSYEPTPAQVRETADAALYFTIGVPFEDTWLPRLAGIAPKLRTVDCLKGIKRLRYADDALALADLELGSSKEGAGGQGAEEPAGHNHERGEHDHDHDHAEHGHGEHDHAEGAEDPHVWLSPMLVREMLGTMTRELAKAVPDKAAEFRRNAAAFADELTALDEELAKTFSAFPKEKRVFLTFHPSWRYFAHNYGLTELSLEVEGKEPGPKTMVRIVDLARRFNIKLLLVEPQFSQSAAKAVAQNIGATVAELDPLREDLPTLYRDLANILAASFARQ